MLLDVSSQGPTFSTPLLLRSHLSILFHRPYPSFLPCPAPNPRFSWGMLPTPHVSAGTLSTACEVVGPWDGALNRGIDSDKVEWGAVHCSERLTSCRASTQEVRLRYLASRVPTEIVVGRSAVLLRHAGAVCAVIPVSVPPSPFLRSSLPSGL